MNNPTPYGISFFFGWLFVTVVYASPVIELVSGAGSLAAEQRLYVATTGSDSNPGTLAAPLASLTGARDAVRRLKATHPKEDITVYIRDGMYFIHETVVFSLEDSGSEDQTITYAAYPGETPVFSSGVNVRRWRKLTDAPEALPDEARSRVWVADVPETMGGAWRFMTLFDGETRLPRASMEGFVSAQELEVDDFWKGRYASNEKCSVFKFPKGAMKAWANLEDVEVKAFPAGYCMNMLGIASVDEATGTAITTIPATYPIQAWPDGEPTVWVENLLEGLDSPGEWVLNTREGKLYLWPKDDCPGDSIYAPRLRELVRFEGDVDKMGPVDVPISHIVLRGLTFTHGDRDVWTLDDAAIQHDWEICDKDSALVRFRSSEHCLVDECCFSNTGGTGLRFDLHSQYNTVRRSLFEYLGQAGVFFCGYGSGTKDVSYRNQVINNRIHHCGTIYQHGHGIIFWNSGENRIAHNLIHDTPRKAISVSGARCFFFNPKYSYRRECSKQIRWNELPAVFRDPDNWRGKYSDWDYTCAVFSHIRNNVIEYNEAYRVLGIGRDGAAINMTGHAEGNIIRRNYVHHIENGAAQAAIRLDIDGRGTLISENILYNIRCYGIIYSDRGNHAENNILVDVLEESGIIYVHGRTPGRIQRNIIYLTGPSTNFIETREDCGAFPSDFNLFYSVADPDGAAQRLEKLQGENTNADSIVADPLFVSLEKEDFRLRPDSPVFKLGFKRIDVDKIGLREDFPKRYLP